MKAPLPISIWTEVQPAADCRLCDAPRENRHSVPVYPLSVCDLCWQRAQDGWRQAQDSWPKEAEPILFAALAKAGLLIPDRNDRDLLPRQYALPKDCAL